MWDKLGNIWDPVFLLKYIVFHDSAEVQAEIHDRLAVQIQTCYDSKYTTQYSRIIQSIMQHFL